MIAGNNQLHYNLSGYKEDLQDEMDIPHFYKSVYHIPAFPNWKEQEFSSIRLLCFYKNLLVHHLALMQMKNPITI